MTKAELQAQVEQMRLNLEQAHGLLASALGYELVEDDEWDEEDEGDDDEEQAD